MKKTKYKLTKEKLDKIDWFNSTNQEIADALGVKYHYVSTLRRLYCPESRLWGKDHEGKPRTLNCIRGRVDWLKVDWSVKNSVIAKELNVKPYMVTANRKKFAPDTIGQHYVSEKKRNMWGNVDWGMTDAAIGKLLNVSREAARQQRNGRGEHKGERTGNMLSRLPRYIACLSEQALVETLEKLNAATEACIARLKEIEQERNNKIMQTVIMNVEFVVELPDSLTAEDITTLCIDVNTDNVGVFMCGDDAPIPLANVFSYETTSVEIADEIN